MDQNWGKPLRVKIPWARKFIAYQSILTVYTWLKVFRGIQKIKHTYLLLGFISIGFAPFTLALIDKKPTVNLNWAFWEYSTAIFASLDRPINLGFATAVKTRYYDDYNKIYEGETTVPIFLQDRLFCNHLCSYWRLVFLWVFLRLVHKYKILNTKKQYPDWLDWV